MAERMVTVSGAVPVLAQESVLSFPAGALSMYLRRFRVLSGFPGLVEQGTVGFVKGLAFRGGRWCVDVFLADYDGDGELPDPVSWDWLSFLERVELEPPEVPVRSKPAVVDLLTLCGRYLRVVRPGIGHEVGSVWYFYSVALNVRGEWQAVLGFGDCDGCQPVADFLDVFDVLACSELLDRQR